MRDPNELMEEYRQESANRRAARRAKKMMLTAGGSGSQIKMHAFEDRQGRFIFVKVPGEYGRYVRTGISVVLAKCPACGSELGEPCKGQYDRYTGSVHGDRLVAARRFLVQMMPGKDGGVGKAIAGDGEEPPLAADDLVHDEVPLNVDERGEDGIVDLRRYFE